MLYTSEVSINGFRIKTIEGSIVIEQLFNPETGLNFTSEEEVIVFMNKNYGFMPNEKIEVTDELIKGLSDEIVKKVIELLNSVAKGYRYDSIDSISKYINSSPNPESNTYEIESRYKTESIELANYASKCWAYVEATVMQCVVDRQLPSIDIIMNGLPSAPELR